MKKPFFTIITPTLNSEKYLEECLKSVETQSFKDWEHIFIDAYSRDNTIRILRKYKKRNPDKVFIYQYPKKGITDAFNKGIINSKGKFLSFLNSDDLLEKEALRKVHNELIRKNTGWLYGGNYIIDKNGKRLYKRENPVFNYKKILYYDSICHQSVFTSKKIFKKYGLFNYKHAMDYDYFLRIGKNEIPIRTKFVVCSFRRSGSNSSYIHWREVLAERKKIAFSYSTTFLDRTIITIFNNLTYLKKLVINFKVEVCRKMNPYLMK